MPATKYTVEHAKKLMDRLQKIIFKIRKTRRKGGLITTEIFRAWQEWSDKVRLWDAFTDPK
jgi:hypothetical protein